MTNPNVLPPSLRILLVSRRSAPAHGGVESYLQHVSRALAAQHRVELLTQRIDDGASDRLTDTLRPPPRFEPFNDNGVRVSQLRFTWRKRLSMWPNVGQVVPVVRRYAYGPIRVPMASSFVHVAAPAIAHRARDFDVIHVWADGFLALAAVRAASVAGRPVLVTPFAHRKQWGGDRISVAAYQRADRTIGLLQDNCALLRELGAPADRVVECSVCSPGVARGRGAAWRRQHGVDGPLIAFLAVRRPYKGFDVLVEALPELARLLPSATLVVAGPGDPVPDGQPLRVIDRGIVSDDERAGLLEASDVLCLPSAGEIYPSSILEAWSAATPVVTSDIAPLAELMKRSGGGLAVPRESHDVATALASVITGGRRLLGEAGYAYWRATATVDAVADRHLELYRQVLAERAPAPNHDR